VKNVIFFPYSAIFPIIFVFIFKKINEIMEYDIAIIGGGPAGYNAAERAATNGLKTVLFEKKAIGGVCLNEGCIPSKTLLYSAKLSDSAKGSSKYGIDIEGTPSFALDKIIGRKNKVVKKLTAGVRMKLVSAGVSIIEGEASVEGVEEVICIACNNERYNVRYLLLCTGSDVVIPPVKGLSAIDYWTSKETLDNTAIPQSLAIIGGGVIGMEFASFFNSMGVQVHVIEMMPEILGAMDKETSAMLRAEYTKKGISFYINTKVTEVSGNAVTIEQKGKASTLEVEKILVCVGRKAVLDMPGLEKLNIELRSNGVKVNEYMQTSNPRVYACGDVTGFSMLAHTAMREADVAVNHILGVEDRMSYNAIPSVVYTNPEIAGVGKTEEELKADNIRYGVLKLPMAYSGRFVAENESGNGLCKLIVNEQDQIVGCHLIGNPASELIVVAGIAVERKFTVDEFKQIVFPHPTVGEIIHESLYL
jgi:dihydrolipoamide dehydrogenase